MKKEKDKAKTDLEKTTVRKPLRLFDDFQSDLERLWRQSLVGRTWPFDRMTLSGDTDWMPRLDAYQSNGDFCVEVDLPGMKKKDVKVSVEDGGLVIEGERKDEHEVEEEDFYRFERSYGSFHRRLPLPAEADMDNVKARFKNGVLQVKMPMVEIEAPEAKEVTIF